jgi:hypothetical protein
MLCQMSRNRIPFSVIWYLRIAESYRSNPWRVRRIRYSLSCAPPRHTSYLIVFRVMPSPSPSWLYTVSRILVTISVLFLFFMHVTYFSINGDVLISRTFANPCIAPQRTHLMTLNSKRFSNCFLPHLGTCYVVNRKREI